MIAIASYLLATVVDVQSFMDALLFFIQILLCVSVYIYIYTHMHWYLSMYLSLYFSIYLSLYIYLLVMQHKLSSSSLCIMGGTFPCVPL